MPKAKSFNTQRKKKLYENIRSNSKFAIRFYNRYIKNKIKYYILKNFDKCFKYFFLIKSYIF